MARTAYSLSHDLKEYGRYIIPTWLFPVYFIAWGFFINWLKLPFDYVLLLFFLTVAPPFFGTYLWATRARKHISYGRFWFLTMAVPGLITFAIVMLFVVVQPFLATRSSP